MLGIMWRLKLPALLLMISLLQQAESFVPSTVVPFSSSSVGRIETRQQYRTHSCLLQIKAGNVHHVEYRRNNNNNNNSTNRFRNRLSLWGRKARNALVRKSTAGTDSTSNVDDAEIEARTWDWIQKSVIGLNLCPFAERPMKNKDLYIKVVRGHDDTEVGKAVAAALHFTANEKPGVTTIVVAPEYNPDDFERYLGMVQFLEQVVMDRDEMKLSEYVQIAPFHPLFQLDEDDSSGEKDPIGAYTNRAPYPMFHVIRADDVSDAVDKLDGDPGKVWRRNQRLLKNMGEKMGKEKTIEIVMGRQDEEKDPRQMKLLYEILKQTMIEMKREAKNGEPKQMERGSWER